MQDLSHMVPSDPATAMGTNYDTGHASQTNVPDNDAGQWGGWTDADSIPASPVNKLDGM